MVKKNYCEKKKQKNNLILKKLFSVPFMNLAFNI